jgi:protein SCO1/2
VQEQHKNARAMKVMVNSILVVALGIAVLFVSTNGFSAFTSEGVRRLKIRNNPVDLPHVPLVNSTGDTFYIQSFKDKSVLVDFIFTNCSSLCPMVTENFKLLHKKLQESSLKDEVVLLTISFDPERDTPSVLKRYGDSAGARESSWYFATVKNKETLQELLDVYGIVVIPAANGQFEHNSAIHLVDTSGKLAKIYDYDAINEIVQDLGASNRALQYK